MKFGLKGVNIHTVEHTHTHVHNNELWLHSADCTVQVTGHASRIVQDIVFDFYLVLAVCMDGHNVWSDPDSNSHNVKKK